MTAAFDPLFRGVDRFATEGLAPREIPGSGEHCVGEFDISPETRGEHGCAPGSAGSSDVRDVRCLAGERTRGSLAPQLSAGESLDQVRTGVLMVALRATEPRRRTVHRGGSRYVVHGGDR